METIRKFKPIECPNCGAPLRSENCEYCGSHIDIGTNLQIELEMERLRKKIAYEQCQLAQASQSNQISAVLYANTIEAFKTYRDYDYDPYSYI